MLQRFRLSLLLLMAFALGVFFITFQYLKTNRMESRSLYQPAITLLRVGGMPASLKASPVIEVMDGAATELTCEIVPPSKDDEHTRFKWTGYGDQVIESSVCDASLTMKGSIGTEFTLTMEYIVVKDDGSQRSVDSKSVKVVLVPMKEFFRIRTLTNEDENALVSISVPHKVVPFVDAAMKLDEKPDYLAVAFFVRPLGVDSLQLQMMIDPDDTKEVKINTAPFKKFRTWGSGIDGFAAWPGGHEPGSGKKSPPIEVGDETDYRAPFEIMAGLYRRTDLGALQSRSVTVKRNGDGTAQIEYLPLTLERAKDLAYNSWLSEPLAVVRVMPGAEGSSVGSVAP